MTQALSVDCDFPGGNIQVDKIEGNEIFLHQDLRDTDIDWFYWYFRVKGAAGSIIRVHFTASDALGARGPALSSDKGKTWRWLGTDCTAERSFTCMLPEQGDEVRFSFAMPYTQANLERFLRHWGGNPHLQRSTLCLSRNGRAVELLRLGMLDGDARFQVLLTARHHCCEMMANYTQEGMIETILGENEIGNWCREHVEWTIIPFMDKDGVEEGDQGKNRRPHDHNRDYIQGIYPETRALRQYAQKWDHNLVFSLDMHCPWMRGEGNETIYFVGMPDEELWQRVGAFSDTLEKYRMGDLPYYRKDNLPFGASWNTGTPPEQLDCSDWLGRLPHMRFAATVEIPYAVASGVEVNAESARSFGHDLVRAIRYYLDK